MVKLCEGHSGICSCGKRGVEVPWCGRGANVCAIKILLTGIGYMVLAFPSDWLGGLAYMDLVGWAPLWQLDVVVGREGC